MVSVLSNKARVALVIFYDINTISKDECYPTFEKVLEIAEFDTTVSKCFRVYSPRIPSVDLCTRFKKKKKFHLHIFLILTSPYIIQYNSLSTILYLGNSEGCHT